MAKRAGLIKKDSAWESYPHVMLRRRAVTCVHIDTTAVDKS